MPKVHSGKLALLPLAGLLAVLACGDTSSPPTLATPSDVDFGEVDAGGSAARGVTLTNTTGSPLDVTDVITSGAGVITSGRALPFTLQSGESTRLFVEMAPTTSGDLSGTVSLLSTAETEPITVIRTRGKVRLAEQLVASPGDVAFGGVPVGERASQDVTLTNAGTQAVRVTSLSVSSGGVSVTGLPLPATFAPGESATFNVSFAPTAAGGVQGSVAVKAEWGRPASVVAVSGTGVSPTAPVMVTMAPARVDFRDVSVGSFSTQGVTLTNSSSQEVTISELVTTGTGFAASGIAPATVLAPGGSATVSVKFTPTAVGAMSGQVAVRTAGQTEPAAVVDLAGNGVAAASITSVAVRDATVETSKTVQMQADVVAVGTIDRSVTWSVDPASLGTVDPTSGVYTAPAAPGTYRVWATSKADPEKKDFGLVSVSAPAQTGSITSVYTYDQSVAAGQSVQMVADVTAVGTIDTSVTWSVDTASLGTVNAATGVYTAPATAGTYRVWATSKADPTKKDFGLVTVTGTAPPPPSSTPPPGVVPAFLGAEGGGSLTKGGRGGTVIEVTNLNDSGSGSLRACVQASGPRTCVFRVGGTIALQSALIVTNPYLTVAGQTAPGGGIQLSGKNTASTAPEVLDFRTHDIIWRYTRLRKGYNASTPDQGGDVVVMRPGAYAVVLDHNSISWTQDENIDIGAWSSGTPPNSITVSWNIIAEPLSAHPTSMGMGAYSREANDQITNIDFHHNFIPNSSHRNPLVGSKSLRWVNNILYNYGYYANQFEGGVQVDIINNIYKSGPLGGGDPGQDHEIQVYPAGYPNTASGSPSLYVSGNKGPNHPDPAALATEWTDMVREVASENGMEIGLLSTSYRRTSPMPAAGIAIGVTPISSLESVVIPTAGASQRLDCNGNWVAARDAVDTRLVNDYQAGRGSLPSTEDSVGGFPNIAAGTPCSDADHDGMPDAWETARGLNPNDASDARTVSTGGYTNLERYLNGP